MIRILAFRNDENIVKDIKTSDIRKFLSNRKNLLWIDLESPGHRDFDVLKEVFDFHPLALEDSQQPSELPKIDQFDDHVFIVFHKLGYNAEEKEAEMKEYNIFLGKNFIVTVHYFESEDVNNIMELYRRKPNLFAKGCDFVLHRIIDSTVDKYLPMVNQWDNRLDDLEDRVIEGNKENVMEEILAIKRDIAELKKSVAPQREVINRLTRKDFRFISEKAKVYFTDIYDHINRVYSILEMDRELTAGIFDAYLSMTSHRMNEVMKALTIIATIFIPLTFITGIYGMNFSNMPEIEWTWGYPFSWAVMIAISLIMLAYFKKKEWV